VTIGPGSEVEVLQAQLHAAREALAELQEERGRLERLLIELPHLFASLDPDSLASGVAEAARQLTDARFAVYVPEDGDSASLITGLEWTDFADRPDFDRAPLLQGPRPERRSHRVDDLARWALTDESARVYGVLRDGRLIRSWLAVPVGTRSGDLTGILYLGHHRPSAFTVHDEARASILCAGLGLALESAQLVLERERVLRALQVSLLPPLLPRMPGMDIAARYRPADASSELGGDFYDVFSTGPDRWAVVLGDVCGFGPEAAAITGTARYTLRALATDGASPARTLAKLNEVLLQQVSFGRFLTAVLAEVTAKPDRVGVRLAIAGHPPPLLLGDDESVVELDGHQGTLLGVLPETKLHDFEIELSPGDALVLYTDGVIEARDREREVFGVERLTALLATCAGRSASGIARRIERAALDYADEQPDDIAIVVLRCLPS
jgi:serine phosphatase RsbU (regulator of sigma subunit)